MVIACSKICSPVMINTPHSHSLSLTLSLSLPPPPLTPPPSLSPPPPSLPCAHQHNYVQKQLLDDRIESVVLRVDEFKKQLETMHENIASSSEKMEALHEKMTMLKELFKRIDQAEVIIRL